MLDLSKPMTTRDGKPARLVYDQLHNHEYGPLVFAIMHEGGIEKIGFRDLEGRYPATFNAPQWDIINAPVPDNMVIVQVVKGMVDVTQVPDGVVVKVMDYDVLDADDDHFRDEKGRPCTVELFGPSGLYPSHVWPFA